MTAAPVLTVRGACRMFNGDRAALRGADLDLYCGRVTVLLGPSGSGKSTLLRAIAGLERLDGGEIRHAGEMWSGPDKHIAPEKRRVGVVFQDFALFPHLTALDNVAFGLNALPRPERREHALKLLADLEMGALAHAYPHELSGGEQQRVALARALAPGPDIVLMDEPFSGLDRRLRASMREQALKTLRASNAAILVVTHDTEEAMAVADDLALMAAGRIIQSGPPDTVYLSPSCEIAARLTGDVESFRGLVKTGFMPTPLGDLPADGIGDDSHAVALIRPEGIRLNTGDGVSVRVVSRRPQGAWAAVTIETADGSLWRASAPLTAALEPGSGATAAIDPAFARVVADGAI
ncbi:MAG: ABC transporter ATP-binding protein [Maricaulaceae bacterium]|nr:ABC transporter ATP-binding protein [Maricaulaceae bacterium]